MVPSPKTFTTRAEAATTIRRVFAKVSRTAYSLNLSRVTQNSTHPWCVTESLGAATVRKGFVLVRSRYWFVDCWRSLRFSKHCWQWSRAAALVPSEFLCASPLTAHHQAQKVRSASSCHTMGRSTSHHECCFFSYSS